VCLVDLDPTIRLKAAAGLERVQHERIQLLEAWPEASDPFVLSA